MPIDRFNKQQFESALPKLKASGGLNMTSFAWQGLDNGEHCWAIHAPNHARIRLLVRSSIDSSGWSADTGEDSIRIILQCFSGEKWVAMGKGPDAYTTRVPGWEKRLREKIRQVLWKVDSIKQPFLPEEGAAFCKQGRNEGRPFAHIGGNFKRWLD